MSIPAEVGLLGGRTATMNADLDEDVGTLKRRTVHDVSALPHFFIQVGV